MMRNVFFLFCFACLAFAASLSAAGPITNRYLANRYLERCPHYSYVAKRAFVAGVLFPDICHILPESKKEGVVFHVNASLEEVRKASSPFAAGVLFHGFINRQRELYHEQSGLYNLLQEKAIAKPQLTLDFWEDEILFSYKDGNSWSADLQKIYPEEQATGIDVATIKSWHRMMQSSGLFPPSTFLPIVTKLRQSFGSHTPQELSLVNTNLSRLHDDKQLIGHVAKIVHHFDLLFSEEEQRLAGQRRPRG